MPSPAIAVPSNRMWVLPRGSSALAASDVDAAQKARLLYAVIEMVASRGYPATRISDIVACAKVSKRTFYEHFADKEDCYLAAYEAMTNDLAEYVIASQKPHDDWETRLRDSLYAFLEYCQNHPRALTAMLVQIHSTGPRAWAKREWRLNRFAVMQKNLYRILQEEDPGRPDLPDLFFRGCVNAVEEMVSMNAGRGQLESLVDLTPQIFQFLRNVYRGPYSPDLRVSGDGEPPESRSV